jgi:hypothetical protein
MKLRALPLIFAALLLCSDSASSLSVQQNQAPPEAQVPNPEQPATTSTTPSAPQNQPQNPPPANQAPIHKASPAPTPPVLKHRTHKAAARTGRGTRKKMAARKSASEPGKVVVRNGGAKEGSAQLTPATSPAQAQHQRASTANLLAATDANLKRVAGRQLTPAQQSMVEEIQTYMRQAKAAAASSDTNRAQTLAYKARLLSDELARK